MFYQDVYWQTTVVKSVFSEIVPVIDNSSHRSKKERLETTFKLSIAIMRHF